MRFTFSGFLVPLSVIAVDFQNLPNLLFPQDTCVSLGGGFCFLNLVSDRRGVKPVLRDI
jgi:hypothetical protein